MEHAPPTQKKGCLFFKLQTPGNPQITPAAGFFYSELLGKPSIHLPPDTGGVIVSWGTYWNVTSGKGISILFPPPVTPGTRESSSCTDADGFHLFINRLPFGFSCRMPPFWTCRGRSKENTKGLNEEEVTLRATLLTQERSQAWPALTCSSR